MAFVVPRDENIKISWGICKPLKGSDMDDAIAHITTLTASLECAGSAKAAILRSINGSWAAVFAVWNCELDTDQCPIHVPEEAEFRKKLTTVGRLIDSGWLQLSSHEQKDLSFAKLCVGDIVSLRRIYSSRKKQDVLAYCCLAVSKAYFTGTQGILSCTFYKSMDGKRIVGVGVWDSIESASAPLDGSKGCPGEVYWTSLGAKKLKYEICQVVYVTEQTFPETLCRQSSYCQR